MSAIDNLVSIMGAEVGKTNGAPYWNYVRGSGFINNSSTPWCACFASWALNKAGITAPGMSAKGSAAAGAFASAASKKNKLTTDMSKCARGDLLIYDYNGNGYATHIGVCTGCSASGDNYKVSSIEGNTAGQGNAAGGRVGQYTSMIISPKGKMVSGRTFSTVHVVKIDGSSNATIDGANDMSDSTNNKLVSWVTEILGGFTDSYSTVDITISNTQPKYVYKTTYKTTSENVTREALLTVDSKTKLKRTRSAHLLSTPTYVESPFIKVKFGNYTFGTYTSHGSIYKPNTTQQTLYPNYMDSINITKVNGSVNQYQIKMTYQIEAGEDPNFIDKVLASVGYGTITISYGDWNAPTFIYKEEEALITKVSSNVDFAKSSIHYTVTCTSACVSVTAQYQNFPSVKKKPSDVIKSMLYGNDASSYGLLDAFPGMKNSTFGKSCISSDDKKVTIPAKVGIDPLSYINFLVTCMICKTNSDTDAIQDSSYYMSITDDVYNEHGGTYFKVVKVESGANSSTINQSDVYEVDVGYPTDNLITNFQINDDNSWALLYEYSANNDLQNYSYSILNDGTITTEYSPNVMRSADYISATPNMRTWWTQMTKFPISATLTLKGLLRPAMLMSYLRVNALFYGQRHVSSGLYIITKQEDSISSGGYRTTLSLTRIGGDEDYLGTITEKVTKTIAVQTKTKNKNYQGSSTLKGKTFSVTSNVQTANIKGDPTTTQIEKNLVSRYGYGEDTFRHGYLKPCEKSSCHNTASNYFWKKGKIPYWRSWTEFDSARSKIKKSKLAQAPAPQYRDENYTIHAVQFSNTYMQIVNGAAARAGVPAQATGYVAWRPVENPDKTYFTFREYFTETTNKDGWGYKHGTSLQRPWFGWNGKVPTSLKQLIEDNPDSMDRLTDDPYKDEDINEIAVKKK